MIDQLLLVVASGAGVSGIIAIVCSSYSIIFFIIIAMRFLCWRCSSLLVQILHNSTRIVLVFLFSDF